MNETLDDMQKVWEKEFTCGPTHIIKKKIIWRMLEPLQGLRILDLGCGGGAYTCLLEKKNRVVALDLSFVSVKKVAQLREQDGMNVMGPVFPLPFKEGVFDAVVAFDVLEHIQQDSDAVLEIRRILKPGGSLLFVVPEDMRLFSPIDIANGHFRRYSSESIRALLESFNIVFLSDFGFPFMRIYLSIFGKRLLSLREQLPANFLTRLLSMLLVGLFHLDRIFNGSFRGVELFGAAKKHG